MTQPTLTERQRALLASIAEHPGKRPTGATPEEIDGLWQLTLVEYNPLRATPAGVHILTEEN